MKKLYILILPILLSGMALAQALPLATPESQGISSAAIMRFVDAVENSKNEFHSFVLLRHGKQIAAGWWSPYRKDLKHTLYSTSKSFTSTAIGFAVAENLLTVHDPILKFFPEYRPQNVSENLANMKVKDLLTMSTGQYPEPISIIGNSDNWPRDFLQVAVPNTPGERFNYNSMATYMLSAIVQKLTGQTVLNYLNTRLFHPLGITEADWETDPAGINTGGWGLRLKTESMAKFGQLLLNKGKWNGQQIISEAWIEEATQAHIHQWPEWVAAGTKKEESDWMQGYGYQFWRCRNNAFRADGAFGQYIIVMPDQDAVMAITCETPDMQDEINLVWKHLLPAFESASLPENKMAQQALNTKLAHLQLPVTPSPRNRKGEKLFKGRTFVSVSDSAGIRKIKLHPSGKRFRLDFKTPEGSYSTRFSATNWSYGETPWAGPTLLRGARNAQNGIGAFKTAGHYYWKNDSTIVFQMRYIESPHTRTMELSKHGSDARLKIIPSYNPGLAEEIMLKQQ